ncbi:hypothetical protein [Streptomyces sp. NPDC058373]|uniref:hypothetical protein n=1 Tax=Streptomyces sp. NPDC058373 TaxID=3346465 RepID=UPI0036469923
MRPRADEDEGTGGDREVQEEQARRRVVAQNRRAPKKALAKASARSTVFGRGRAVDRTRAAEAVYPAAVPAHRAL